MATVARKIIEREKIERTGYLDLGNCGLTEVPDLSELYWLETLILANTWWNSEQNSWQNSENIGIGNYISIVPENYLPTGITTLILGGNNRYHVWEINDIQFVKKLTHLTTLYLGFNKISDGQYLKDLTNLSSLFLVSNQINNTIFLENLSNLTRLEIWDNRIRNTQGLEKLQKLTLLNLGKNQVSNGQFLEKLPNLTSLYLWENNICDWGFLGSLKNLSSLYIGKNQISDIAFLKGISNLTTLYLNNNEITNLNYLDELIFLRTLNLSMNKISDGSFLETLPNLTTLDLAENHITDCKFLKKLTNLRNLDLSNNQIKDIEPLLHLFDKGLLTNTFQYGRPGISLYKNPIENPPMKVVEQGSKAILNYFKQIKEQGGTAPLYEAKLIIVGEPDAGKTTLFQILKNPEHEVPNPEDKTTTGVNVLEGLTFEHQNLPPGILFSANLWDFGGQEIQYMTHQFFLTARSLYVILTDDRRENANMAYWFSAADLFGRDDTGRQSPVLVALNSKNFKSASKFDFDLHQFQTDYEHLQIEERRFDFASVGGFGRSDLVQKIKDLLVSLPHVGDKLPRRWPDVRKALRARGKEVNYINEAEFCKICTDNDIPDQTDQFYLSRYLHDLGSILHFQNDPELRDFIILNPSWAVAAVYAVLENKEVAGAEGIFDDDFLGRIWDERYTRPEQSNLLRLMKRDRFEVCFEATGERGKYLAPQLLSASRPAFNWPKTALLRFQFQYEFLPKGIITRLQVRKHEMVAKGETGKRLAWDKGVVFEKDGCQAMVVERELKDRRKIIELEAIGQEKDRIHLLRILRDEVEAIHKKWFSKVKFERMVPCCCPGCFEREEPTFFKFSELLKYERNKERKIKCSAGDELVDVEVSELMEGIFLKDELSFHRSITDHRTGIDLRLTIDNRETMEKLAAIEAGVASVERMAVIIQSNQHVHSGYLQSLLHFNATNQAILDNLLQKIDTLPDTTAPDMERINEIIENMLAPYLEKLPAGVVQAWKSANAKPADEVDMKWTLKFKLPLLFAELEKEVAWDGKKILKLLRDEISDFATGKKKFRELFVED